MVEQPDDNGRRPPPTWTTTAPARHLRLDPQARPRLVEIIRNLNDRINEAQANGWLGEVAGLKTSRDAAARRLVNLEKLRERPPVGPVDLGSPAISDDSA
ncbi:hypothetical protein P3102_34040 [Amycolatopsis sp. QT-25]|uniref:hypothetical protein n=1 Tax=Amycolatopsis sp. QT-25 TaxID=3034022 RepID=UPI0023EDF2E2|nr:hypothetical protein [Amycolatopsis sp. QT-25]WET79003.1 hypothetical protein P3102_34040 [Amycolatopsis sp. QT-25]